MDEQVALYGCRSSIFGIVAILFAAWLAKDVMSRDTGHPGDAGHLRAHLHGRHGLSQPPVSTIAQARDRGRDRHGRPCRDLRERPRAARGIITSLAFLVGALLSGISGFIGMYVAVRQQHPHRRGGPRSPGRGADGRPARRRGLRLPGRRARSARRQQRLLARLLFARPDDRRRGNAVLDRRLRASAPASSPSSPSSAAASTPKRPTSAPIWSARSRPASRRTTRATRPSSPTSSATTSATARAAAPTSSSRPPPRSSAP